MTEPIVVCDNLVKIYKVADLEVVALQGLDLEVVPGEMMAIVGVSGSGKSTLLNILSALDTPSAGRCIVDGNDLTRMGEAQRIAYRRFVIGHIWQQSGRNLLPELNILENVELPQLLGGSETRQRLHHARELLEMVGLGHMS
ncbi:MAG: ABC transporter ATP-binding protein, partial [Ktedonobacteraceae bacterium]